MQQKKHIIQKKNRGFFGVFIGKFFKKK